MTKLEILKEVYQRRGYLVSAWLDGNLKIGEIITEIGGEGVTFGQPFMIVAETDARDALAQFQMCRDIAPERWRIEPAVHLEQQSKPGMRFFRVITD